MTAPKYPIQVAPHARTSSQKPLAENPERSSTRFPAQSAAVVHAERPIWWKSGNIE